MSKINLLDEQLVNLIAAGEVVERPGGVIKELIENAIDAKSENIVIKIEDGGLKRIIVSDDGEGMDQIDASNCLQRHATSKISKNKDLWNIKTMGFRGEALPSIGAVSKLKITTNDGTQGTEIKCEYGKIVSAKPIAAPKGTTVEVEDLFYKTPARLKHMKSAQREGMIIAQIIERIALANPEISFKFYSNDILRLNTKGNNNIQQLYFDIYGSEVAKSLIEEKSGNFDFKIKLELVLPHISRNTKQDIQVFINKRIIDDYFLQKAVVNAYSEYLPKDRYPIASIRIKCDFDMIDVNVHPSKQEVRISGQSELCALIENSIKDILHRNMYSKNIETHVTLDVKEDYNGKNTTYDVMSQEDLRQNEQLKFDSYDLNMVSKVEEITKEEQTKSELSNLKVIGQLKQDYVLCEDEEYLYIIDQHAAQERVNFESICDEIQQEKVKKQLLLIPYSVELSARNLMKIEALNNVFKELGFDIDYIDDNTIVCREIPLWMADYNINDTFNDILNQLDQDKTRISQIELQRKVLATIACHKSIKFNQNLTRAELEQLVKDLGSCKQPYNCPHGRPTIIKYAINGMRKEFGRE